MFIERTMYNRAGQKIGESIRMRVPSETREDAAREIERQQAEFPRRGYNDEHDYWWARPDLGEYQLTRWHVLKGDFD